MKVYALIKNAYDYHACDWYCDIDTLEIFADKDKRDTKKKELESQLKENERGGYDSFEIELQ
jgi:hypothetical protein